MLGLAVTANPFQELIRAPGLREPLFFQRWQGVHRGANGPLQVAQALFDALIQLEAQTEQRQDAVGIVILGPQLGIAAARGFAGPLQRRPVPGVRQQPQKQIFTAEFRAEIRAPPAEPPSRTPLAGPGISGGRPGSCW